MRGKVVVVTVCVKPYRITPAHAGKSSILCPLPYWIEDHPRTCGEKFPSTSFNVVFPGSPPHMRGKAVIELNPELFNRITPAHAGKRQTVIKVGEKN